VWQSDKGGGGIINGESGDASPVIGVAAELFSRIWVDDVSGNGDKGVGRELISLRDFFVAVFSAGVGHPWRIASVLRI
jgi:hypothetical protein